MTSGAISQRTQQRLPGDDRVNSSTPQTGTPSKILLANIPKQAIDEAIDSIKKHISRNEEDERILKHVWFNVQDALEQVPGLKEPLASKDEFRANVTRKGEKNFIDSLRIMAANSDKQGSEAWEDLFQDGTLFCLCPSILNF
jgi:hypothetical protein